MCTVLTFLVLAASGQTQTTPGQIELKAETWFNAPSIRIPENRTYVLFFFSTVQEREVEPWIEKLREIDRREDVVVLGLSPESKERVSRFVDQKKIRFAVGAGSRDYRAFKIKRFPRVIVLSPDAGNGAISQEALNLEGINRWFDPSRGAEPLITGAFTEDSPTDVLRRHAREDSERGESFRALSLLRQRIPPQEFMAYCDELLAQENDVLRRGSLLFQRQWADPSIPESEKEPLFSPSLLGQREEREKPDDGKWAPVGEYVQRIANRTETELFQDFLDRLTDDPVDARIRSSIPFELGHRPDKVEARSFLMQMLPLETDFGVRNRIVGALSEVCDPGDLEAADFLEDQLRTESNVRIVRPMMEYVIRYLRTGEE